MKFLNKEYTKYDSANKSWKNGLFAAMVVLFIFLLFQPFGFRDKDLVLKLILFPVYSLLAYFYTITSFFIVRCILKSKKQWLLKNELLSLVIGIVPFSFLVQILSSLIAGDMPLNLYWYFKLLYYLTGFFVVIAVIEYLYYSNKFSASEIEHLSARIHLFSQQLRNLKPASTSDIISISLEKDSIDINRNKILFISSLGNYLEFYFREHDGQIKKVVKRGRIHQAEKDLEAFPEFFRCHRAFIINLKQAGKIEGNSKNARLVFNQGSEEIPVSRSRFRILKEQFDKLITG